MTISEAEHILDVVSTVLQQDCRAHHQHPISALRGHTLSEILIALKLRIANEFLCLWGRPDFEKSFAEGLQLYDSIPVQLIMSLVADEHLGDLTAPGVYKLDDLAIASMETGGSFGKFCMHVGAHDPRYWERVYGRIGLPHTTSSPRGNSPVRDQPDEPSS